VEGIALLDRALATERWGSYCLQAAIAAVHAEAPTAAATDWRQIAGLYAALDQLEPSPVVQLNLAVARAEVEGPAAGLRQLDELLAGGALGNYHLAHAARADFCRRLGQTAEARRSYRRALELAQQEPERRFLARRLNELAADEDSPEPTDSST
jgi:RNA polymerase sigma-70 factor (ECF subfamily)